LSHVFCFDVPTHAEDYIHRIGRTARAGRLGRSFMLATPEDGRAVAAIVKLIGKEIPFSVIPGIEEVELDYDERRRRGARRDTRPARQPARTGDAGRRSTPTGQDRRARVTNAALPDMAGSNVTPFPGAAGVHRSGQQERKAREAPKVVGFGDHLPAFLSRAPRIVARP
jgi:superfamily II DNA/RNA helicase